LTDFMLPNLQKRATTRKQGKNALAGIQ